MAPLGRLAARAGLLLGMPAAAHAALLSAIDDPASRETLLGAGCPPELRDIAALRADIGAVTTGGVSEVGRWLAGELSSDHAGETGAVYIYRGALQALQVRALGCPRPRR